MNRMLDLIRYLLTVSDRYYINTKLYVYENYAILFILKCHNKKSIRFYKKYLCDIIDKQILLKIFVIILK